MQGWSWGAERPDSAEPHRPRRGRWSQAEVARLKDMYGLRDDEAIARELDRSPESIRRMAQSLFRGVQRTGPWTAQEVEKLKQCLGATQPEVIARVLGRDLEEVQRQIFELGRIQHNGRWTRDEQMRLKRMYGTRSDEDLARIFGRGVEAIRRQATRLCLAKDKAFLKKRAGKGATRMPRWSREELELLRDMYPSHPNLDIAQRLNRSVKSIVSKAHHIGLRKDAARLQEMGRENVSLRYGRR